MARVKIKRQVTGDGMRGVQMRIKTIDKVGVLMLKELKTRILPMEDKLEPFIIFLSVSNKLVSYNYMHWYFLSIVPDCMIIEDNKFLSVANVFSSKLILTPDTTLNFFWTYRTHLPSPLCHFFLSVNIKFCNFFAGKTNKYIRDECYSQSQTL